MVVTPAAVHTAAVRTASAHRHWLPKPIGFYFNQCGLAPRSSTAYRRGVPRQRIDLTSHCRTSQVRQPPFQGPTWPIYQLRHTYLGHAPTLIQAIQCIGNRAMCKLWLRTCGLLDSVLAVVLHRHRPLGHARRWRNLPVYRPLVDLSTMEERHVILTYRLDRATIQELCAQLEPDLMSPIRQPTGIPPLGKVLEQSYIVFPEVGDLPTVKGDFYALGHSPNIIGAIDGTHVALVPPSRSEQVYRNQKSYHSMNVQIVCLADQYISHVNAKFPGSVHDAYILRNSSIPYVMGQLQRHRVWLLGDSGYPNLSWLLTPVRNPRTRAEERYNEAHGQTRRVIERTFGLLKARFRCLHMKGGSLMYSPKKVCQIIVACCMLHNLGLHRQVPFLQEDGPDGGVVAAVEPVESEEEEAEEDDIENRNTVIQQYFQ
ncbi:hypothetical protein NDU88_004581 [Pleurodeles waltl]|uniref:DDE Tnp4 domain-containing protein n=1 Tax=Pleurodeles waltl TaxID=8319 RepID=A0AAV7VKQ5_PLEWA|nr:hypothetical protein NDU88_004581 [Pleurodeles waltl]